MAKFGAFKFGAQKFGTGTTTVEALGSSYMYILDSIGLNIAGVATKSDITSAIPRISIGTDQRKHTDFSERDTFGQNSFHHGFGQRDLLDPLAFADSQGLMTWWSTQVTLAPQAVTVQYNGGDLNRAGYVSDMLPYAGNLYFLWFGDTAADNAIFLYNNTSDNFDLLSSAPIDVATGEPKDLHVWEKDSTTSSLLMVAQGETVNAIYFNGTTWASLGVPANFFQTFDGKLWRADNLNEAYGSTDATNTGSWGTAIKVGDASYPIRGMLSGYKGAMWFGKDDGLYSMRYDTVSLGYVVTKEIDLGAVIDSNNGVAMMEHQGFLYMSVRNGLLKYDGLTVQYVGPDQAQSPNGDGSIGGSVYQDERLGKIISLAHDNNFVYAAVSNDDATNNSHLMVYGGTGWHKAYAVTANVMSSVFFSSALATSGTLSYPCLWYSNNFTGLKRVKLPRSGVDPLQDGTLPYESSGWLTTSWYDAQLIDIDKVFFDFVARVINLDDSNTGNRFKVEFQMDDIDDWYLIGTMVHSPEQTMFFPDNSKLDPNVFGRKIRFRFTFIRNEATTTTTPVLLSYASRFVVRPQVRYGWNLTVKVYENMHNFARADESMSAQEFREFVYSRRDKQTPVHLDEASQPEGLTNRLTNPSFELDTSGTGLADSYTAVGNITGSLTAQYKSHGVRGQKVVCNLTNDTAGISFPAMDCVAGKQIFTAVDLFVASGDVVEFQLLDPNSAVVASVEFEPTGLLATHESRFQRGTIFYTPLLTGNYTARIVRLSATANAVTTFYCDSAEFIHDYACTRENEFYIDGDQLRCRWNGQPHASTSVRQHGYFCYITGLTETVRYIEDRQNQIIPSTEITLQLRETL